MMLLRSCTKLECRFMSRKSLNILCMSSLFLERESDERGDFS